MLYVILQNDRGLFWSREGCPVHELQGAQPFQLELEGASVRLVPWPDWPPPPTAEQLAQYHGTGGAWNILAVEMRLVGEGGTQK